jgi:hypothetical protein
MSILYLYCKDKSLSLSDFCRLASPAIHCCSKAAWNHELIDLRHSFDNANKQRVYTPLYQ